MPATPDQLKLKVLGFPVLSTGEGEALVGLGPGKPLAMLAYLAVRRQAARDELIELLWGGIDEAKARNAFRQALHRLRGAIGDDVLPHGRDMLELVPSATLAIDRDVFVAACEAADWSNAIASYSGDFLERFEVGESAFDQWADSERIRLRSRFETALRRQAEADAAAGRWDSALAFGQRLAVLSSFDEDVALFEATLLTEAGRARDALASLRRFAARLRAEFDVAEPDSVRDMIARLERANARHQGADTPPNARASVAPPKVAFVGRGAELGRILAHVRALSDEQGATVLIEGESGIGKTRLVDELVDRATALGPLLVLRGRELTLGSALPYGGVAQALRGVVNAPGVAGTSRHLLGEAARILPELRDAFDLPALTPIDDEGARLRFFEGIAAVLDSAAYERPVCLIVDDVHHASASTIDLLTYLSGRLAHSPVLIVLVARTAAVSAPLSERLTALVDGASNNGNGLRVTLDPLERADTEALLRSLVGSNASMDVAQLVDAARGNPLDAIELVRRAREGVLPKTAAVSLRDSLWARLAAAPPSQRRVFFAAALLQRPATLRLLAAAAHLSESAALDGAHLLEEQGLLATSGVGYVIAHELTAGFVLEMSGPAGRALLAGWAADALAHETDATHAELAHLYALAARSAPAFSHARAAAYDAAALGATSEALRLFGVALTFAADEKSRGEIESALAAFGGRERLLIAASPSAGTDTVEPNAPPDTTPTPRSTPNATPAIEEAPPAAANESESPTNRVGRSRRRFLVAGLAAIIILGAIAVRQRLPIRPRGDAIADSLFVSERDADRSSRERFLLGPVANPTLETAPSFDLAWTDSLTPPWINPVASPDRKHVAIERMTPTGTDLYVVGADRRDTSALVTGGGDDIALGWSPDSRAVLVSRARTLADGSYDADLYAYHINHAPPTIIDTSSRRAVVEAKWSPDGSAIAWVARVGAQRQQDIFVSRADGSNVQNVSANPAEDYHIAWSPDASLLAFTSNRSGGTHLYAYDFVADRLWTLTTGSATDDHVEFSPDGKLVAFESTRNGDAGVYVMRPLGGTPRRVTPAGRAFTLVDWRGRTPPYVDRVRILGPSHVGVGDSASFSAIAIDQSGLPIAPHTLTWSLADSARGGALKPVGAGADSDVAARRQFAVVASSPGSALLAALVPGWRGDTLAIDVGNEQTQIIEDEFAGPLDARRWLPLGQPAPVVRASPAGDGRRALAPNADLEWDSGVLSRAVFELRAPLQLRARVYAPFTRSIPAASLRVALVAATADAAIDRSAPQFTPLISVEWNGESSRFVYAVGRESFAEPASALGELASHAVRVDVANDGSITFYVDDRARWHSTLQVVGPTQDLRARLWLGGRATFGWGAVTDVRLERATGR